MKQHLRKPPKEQVKAVIANCKPMQKVLYLNHSVPNNDIRRKRHREEETMQKKTTNLFKKLKSAIDNYEKKPMTSMSTFQTFQEQKRKKLSQHAQLSQLFVLSRCCEGVPLVMYNITATLCDVCYSKTYLDKNLSRRFCLQPFCAATKQVIFYNTDNCLDITLAGSSPLIAKQHVEKLPEIRSNKKVSKIVVLPSEDKENQKTKNKQKKRREPTQYERVPLFRRYLSQFEDTSARDIPKVVFATVFKYLSNIHSQSTERARPTPIATILRENGLSKYASLSLKISLQFNGEKVPKLSKAMIDRVVRRYEVISKVLDQRNVRAFSTECLIPTLLSLEHRHDLSDLFLKHRTRAVLTELDQKLNELLPDIRKISPADLKWAHFRRMC